MIFKILTMYYIGYGQVEVTTIIDPHIDQHPPFDWQSHILAGKRDSVIRDLCKWSDLIGP